MLAGWSVRLATVGLLVGGAIPLLAAVMLLASLVPSWQP